MSSIKVKGTSAEPRTISSHKGTISEIAGLPEDESVYVHNKKNATFHVPLNNEKASEGEQPIAFLPDEILSIQVKTLKEPRFVNCFSKGFLELFSEEEKLAHEAKVKREKSKKNKEDVSGIHEASGLSKNRTIAIATVQSLKDLDTLEALLDKEDRSSVLAAIEEQIERLEDGNFADEDDS